MSPSPLIELRNLVKKYGEKTAVDDVSLDVYGGGIFGFLGPNGRRKKPGAHPGILGPVVGVGERRRLPSVVGSDDQGREEPCERRGGRAIL